MIGSILAAEIRGMSNSSFPPMSRWSPMRPESKGVPLSGVPGEKNARELMVRLARYRLRPRLRGAPFHEHCDMSGRVPPVKENSALFLDIDGTLLDMARTPEAVVVPSELVAALRRLSQDLRGAVAFVSGRSLATIDALFAPLKFAAVGCHGAQVRGDDGVVQALSAPVSDTVRGVLRDLAQAHPGVLLEDKVYALALHYRLAPEAKPVLDAAMEKHAA